MEMHISRGRAWLWLLLDAFVIGWLFHLCWSGLADRFEMKWWGLGLTVAFNVHDQIGVLRRQKTLHVV